MKHKGKKQYEAPRVRVSYPKARLEEAVRPHGSGIVGNYIPFDHIT